MDSASGPRHVLETRDRLDHQPERRVRRSVVTLRSHAPEQDQPALIVGGRVQRGLVEIAERRFVRSRASLRQRVQRPLREHVRERLPRPPLAELLDSRVGLGAVLRIRVGDPQENQLEQDDLGGFGCGTESSSRLERLLQRLERGGGLLVGLVGSAKTTQDRPALVRRGARLLQGVAKKRQRLLRHTPLKPRIGQEDEHVDVERRIAVRPPPSLAVLVDADEGVTGGIGGELELHSLQLQRPAHRLGDARGRGQVDRRLEPVEGQLPFPLAHGEIGAKRPEARGASGELGRHLRRARLAEPRVFLDRPGGTPVRLDGPAVRSVHEAQQSEHRGLVETRPVGEERDALLEEGASLAESLVVLA